MRKLVRTVLNRLAYGFSIPGANRRVRIVLERARSSGVMAGPVGEMPIPSAKPSLFSDCELESFAALILKSYIAAILKRCPPMENYFHPTVYADVHDAEAFLAFCNDAAVVFTVDAAQPHLRLCMRDLLNRVLQPDVCHHIETKIAVSDLDSGVVERALFLKDESGWLRDLPRQMAAFDEVYDAMPHYLTFLRSSLDLEGDLRARTLTWFFAQNTDVLRGKRLLHIAPEETLEICMREQAPQLGILYETLDGYSTDVDYLADVTDLPFVDTSFDMVICHRVLEHILDYCEALSEFRCIMSDGGLLSLSVPESPRLLESFEWLIQDSSYHDHVRQYGGDLPNRIADCGFPVRLDDSLLKNSLDGHRADGAYPLRHYLCEAIAKAS
jgi:hypothetical protein